MSLSTGSTIGYAELQILCTLSTDNNSSNHNYRNLVHTIRTLDTTCNHLFVDVHEYYPRYIVMVPNTFGLRVNNAYISISIRNLRPSMTPSRKSDKTTSNRVVNNYRPATLNYILVSSRWFNTIRLPPNSFINKRIPPPLSRRPKLHKHQWSRIQSKSYPPNTALPNSHPRFNQYHRHHNPFEWWCWTIHPTTYQHNHSTYLYKHHPYKWTSYE